MKKGIVLVLIMVLCFCSACSIKEIFGRKERTPEELLDMYVDAFMTSDPEKIRDVFPDFIINFKPDKFTKEQFEIDLKREQGFFGEDMVAVYEIKEKKHLTSDELNKLNEQIQDYFKTSKTASDCYYLDGTMTLKGSKGEDPDPLATYYCKYDGSWYLVMG